MSGAASEARWVSAGAEALARWHAFIAPYLAAEGTSWARRGGVSIYGVEMFGQKHRMWQKTLCLGSASAAEIDLGFIWA